MSMREYCLMNKAETVVLNMCLSARANGPTPMPEWELSGQHWVPIEAVPSHILNSYRFWNERP